jgi:hypothetical protein
LTTYRGGNRAQKAGDGEASQLMLGDSEGGLRWSFSSSDSVDDRQPSSKQQLDSRGLDSAGRWQRRWVELLFIGEKVCHRMLGV